jgi:hypothetical protein
MFAQIVRMNLWRKTYMEPKIKQLAEQAKASVPAGLLVNEWIDEYNRIFAELIVRECMTINKVETTALDLPEYNLGMLEGYRRARENMSIHFGVEE